MFWLLNYCVYNLNETVILVPINIVILVLLIIKNNKKSLLVMLI